MNAITPISTSNILSSRAMIVSLTISQWSGRRLDREITNEVNSSHGAAADAGRFNKLLLPADSFAAITKIVGETRAGFIERTLPWMNDGGRIMAADAYLNHSAWMRGQRSKFDAAVQDFVAAYPKLVSDARVRLNGMFKAEDYPDVSVIQSKFNMDTSVMPVPTGTDFRVNMSGEQADIIRADIEKNVREATETAIRDIADRIQTAVGRMVERLRAFKPATRKGEKSEGIFRDSLVQNIDDLINVMPSLNITGDPRITDITNELKKLTKNSAEILRASDHTRAKTADEAERIINNLNDYFGG